MTNLAAKARKLAGILVVPAWRAALRNLGPVRTVVDVGANRGQFALTGPAALYRAVFAGDDRTRLVEAAIGPLRAKVT